jgi:nucleotide-binding universal stress UspA family protein
MFRHILIPTDGSAVARKAVKAGIALAKEMGAKVTAYYALQPFPAYLFAEGFVMDAATITKL